MGKTISEAKSIKDATKTIKQINRLQDELMAEMEKLQRDKIEIMLMREMIKEKRKGVYE